MTGQKSEHRKRHVGYECYVGWHLYSLFRPWAPSHRLQLYSRKVLSAPTDHAWFEEAIHLYARRNRHGASP